MSASATPSPLTAAMIRVIETAAFSRAAFTVGFVIVTPRVTRATSGTIVTLPLDDTVIVCVAGSAAVTGAAAVVGPTWTDRAATATMRAPSANAPIVRMDCDMGSPSPAGPRELGAALEQRRRV